MSCGKHFFSTVTCSIDADFETPEVDGDKPFIVSSYIRGNFYQKGDISTESMLACNDLIYMVVQPYGDGTLYFETPRIMLRLRVE